MKALSLKTPTAAFRGLAAIFLLALAGCGGSPPPRLYLLSSATPAPSGNAAAQASSALQGLYRTASSNAPAVGVLVTIPQYLDRPEIMVRSDTYEMRPLADARWAEGLAVTASHAVADDLRALLPGDDIISLPTNIDRPFDYRISLEFARFESDDQGKMEMSGRWTIAETANDKERASARFRHVATANSAEASAIAATMSDLLRLVSTEIATELKGPRFASGR